MVAKRRAELDSMTETRELSVYNLTPRDTAIIEDCSKMQSPL
jgi:hypothetical protein